MKIGLILQGGGALGAYEYGALKRLYEQPGFQPHVVSGVSIGAINAAALAGSKDKDPIKTLGRLWERFQVIGPDFLPDRFQKMWSLFGNASFFRMRLDFFNAPSWTSFYDTSPLRETLSEYVSFDKINTSAQELILTAINIRTGGIEIFSNRGQSGPLTVEHVLASGSLPPGFPMTQIRGEYYWDGGLFDNTPLAPVIEHLGDEPEVQKQLIVINLFPPRGSVPTVMSEVFDRMFEMIFSNKLQADVDLAKSINEYVEAINQIDSSLPPGSPVRKLPGYKRLLAYKIIHDILYITNEDPELVSGPFDFSPASISRRFEAGYRDADSALNEPARLAASAPPPRAAKPKISKRPQAMRHPRSRRGDAELPKPPAGAVSGG